MFLPGVIYSRSKVKSVNPFVWAVLDGCNAERCVCTFSKGNNETYICSFTLLAPLKRKVGANIARFIEASLNSLKNVKKLKNIKILNPKNHSGIIQANQNTKLYSQYIKLSDDTKITINYITEIEAKTAIISFTLVRK